MRVWPGFSWLGIGPVETCDHGFEHLIFIKSGCALLSEGQVASQAELLSIVRPLEVCYTHYMTESFHRFKGLLKLLFRFSWYFKVFLWDPSVWLCFRNILKAIWISSVGYMPKDRSPVVAPPQLKPLDRRCTKRNYVVNYTIHGAECLFGSWRSLSWSRKCLHFVGHLCSFNKIQIRVSVISQINPFNAFISYSL
jgi:hypothetical protein